MSRSNQKQTKKSKQKPRSSVPQRKPPRRPARNSRAVQSGLTTFVPPERKSGFSNNIFREREFLGDIEMKQGFSITQYDINPGLPKSFPVLSKAALIFESYQVRKLRYIYEPSCSKVVSGSVVLAVDYDPNDEQPVNIVQMGNKEGNIRRAVFDRMSLTCDVRQMQGNPLLKVRQGGLPDLVAYDPGTFYVATQGDNPTPFLAGSIYVEYEIHFVNLNTSQPNGLAPLPPIFTARPSSGPLEAIQAGLKLINVTNTLPAVLDSKSGDTELEFTDSGNYFVDYVSDLAVPTPAPGSQLEATLQLEQQAAGSGVWSVIEAAQWATAAITSDPQIMNLALKSFMRFRKGDRLRITGKNSFPGNDIIVTAGRFFASYVTG